MTCHPTIAISYMVPCEIVNFHNILNVKPSMLKSIQDRYLLFRSTEDENFHTCNTMEILYNDVMEFPNDHYVRDTYDRFVKKYDQDAVDICIVKDSEKIKAKLIDTMLFAIDQLYKETELVIEFEGFKNGSIGNVEWRSKSSMINLLYEAAQENFDIVDQCLVGKNNFIHIKKRREQK